MITIIYPYRNRELSRIKKSLDSLVLQSNKDFCVVFVDYGSDFDLSSSVKKIVEEYKCVKYIRSFHNDQPWSRSKAINIGLRFAETEFVFIADIDIIFHPDLVATLHKLKDEQENVYFQVGYLDEKESKQSKEFKQYNISSKSIPEGQGLSLFSLKSLLTVGGFDEFFHFWGAEDEDVYARLKMAGYSSRFYNDTILLLHQWHETFTSISKEKLTEELYFSEAFGLNKQKLMFNKQKQILKPNNENWGKLMTEEEFQFLNSHQDSTVITNKKLLVENFINIILPNTHDDVVNVIFKDYQYQLSLNYKIKKIFRVKMHQYYSLKDIHDLLVRQLLVYYRDYQYTYKISSDLKSIQLKIKK